MNYTFQFGVLGQYQDQLLAGLWLTVQISTFAILCGTAFGILFAALRSVAGRPVRILIDAYVELIRNTPFWCSSSSSISACRPEGCASAPSRRR